MSTTLLSSSAAAAAALVGNSRDLVGEILIRLPLSSVMRFRLVCKEWCSLTSTQSFIDMYENINQPAGPPHCRSGNNNNTCLVVQYCDNGTDESKSDHFNTLFFNLDDCNNNDMEMKRIREYMHLSNISRQVGEDGNGKMYKTVISNGFFHKMKAYYHIKLISSCRGFLLFTAKPPAAKIPASCMANMFGYGQPREEEYPALILYNPVTKEQLAVIAPPLKYVYCGFYYHSPTKEHRILYRLIEADHPDEIAAEGIVTFLVIELKNDYFMIRRINLKCPNTSSTYYFLPDTSTPPVISNGSLHWIVSEDDLHGRLHVPRIPGCLHTILSFGMESEEFRWMTHPILSHSCSQRDSDGHRHKMNLLEMEGGVLCLCDGFSTNSLFGLEPILEIYVMEDYEEWTWVRRYHISLYGYMDPHKYEYGLHYKALQILQGDQLLLLLLLLQIHHHPFSTLNNVEFVLFSLNHEKQLEGTFTDKKKNKGQRFQVVIDRCRPGDYDQLFGGILRRMRIKPNKKKKKVVELVGSMVVLTPSLASIFQRNRSSVTDQIPIKFIFIENAKMVVG